MKSPREIQDLAEVIPRHFRYILRRPVRFEVHLKSLCKISDTYEVTPYDSR